MSNKIGVIFVKKTNLTNQTKNIGDYIQTIAASKFGSDVEYLDRDSLSEYVGENQFPLNTIVNGWFMASPEHFPPSRYIKPLYVSFHLTPTIQKQFFTDSTIAHLKQYEPIGCRDLNTVKLMQTNGIKAYFSGCLTLTLNKDDYKDKYTGDIYLVDLYCPNLFDINILSSFKRLFRYSFNFLFNRKKIKAIASRIKECSYKYKDGKGLLIYATKIFSTYKNTIDFDILSKAIYQEQEIPLSEFRCESDKYSFANTLLKKYANAKLVVTSRIHCALPCLGLETPVVFASSSEMERSIKPTRSTGRLAGLIDLFRCINVTDLDSSLSVNDFEIDKQLNRNMIISNKTNYLHYRNNIISICKSFINNNEF